MAEFSRRETESSEEMADLVPKRRFCMSLPCFSSGRSAPAGPNWWQKMRAPEHHDEGWWSRGVGALKKLREWSEIAAGPRWKTFIRRFNRNRSGGGGKHSKYQYDPLSYALNFDDGPGQNGSFDEEYGSRNFSTRYAAVPGSASSSADVSEEFPGRS